MANLTPTELTEFAAKLSKMPREDQDRTRLDAKGLPLVTINANDEAEYVTQYVLAHRSRTIPIILRIDPRQGLDRCVTVQVPNGIFVGLDLRTIKVPTPPGKVV